MKPPGLEAFQARDPHKTKKYSFERDTAALEPAHERLFKKNRAAWQFFQAQPPSYRKVMAWWIISAVKDETRAKRLTALIDACAAGRRLL